MTDTVRALAALRAVDPGCDHDTWIRVGMAAQAAGLSFDDFDRWSADASNYNRRDCESAWRSFKPGGGIGPGTLYEIARKSGWRDQTNGEHHKALKRPRPARKPAPKAERPPFDVAAVWLNSEPATSEHAYIRRKVGQPDGLRVVPAASPLRVNRQLVAGWLVVPLYDGEELATLQFIGPDGDKLNAPGTMRGWFTVGGHVSPGATVYVCEGIGQAWSAHQATQSPAVVAFGLGRMKGTAKSLADRGARVVLVADVATEAKIKEAAGEIGCTWVAPPADLGKNGDLNDLHQRGGLTLVTQLLAQAREPEMSEATSRFRFMTVGELLRAPVVPWRVLHVIPSRGLIVVWGASGSGKTFAVLDMAASIVRGLPWAGRRTKRGAVAYIAAEGQLRNRIDAYLLHNGLKESELAGLRVLDSAVNLLDATADMQPLMQSLRGMAGETGGLAAIVVDTLNRAMPGGDENSSEDMGMVIAAAGVLERELGCAVIFIHHSGKDESKGSRGHSSLKAASDAELSVKRDGDRRTVTAEKVRDGEDGVVLMTFRLASVELGPMSEIDPDAEPDERRTSCVVEATDVAQPARTSRLSDTDELALRVLREMCADTTDRTAAT